MLVGEYPAISPASFVSPLQVTRLSIKDCCLVVSSLLLLMYSIILRSEHLSSFIFQKGIINVRNFLTKPEYHSIIDIKPAGLYRYVSHILLVYLLPRFNCVNIVNIFPPTFTSPFKVFKAAALTGIHSRAFQKCITMCIYIGVGVWSPAHPISLTDFKDSRISIAHAKDF